MDSRFQRKVQTRKFAMDNSWHASPIQHPEQEAVPEQIQDENQRRWDSLIENLLAADGAKFNDGYWVLHSQKKVLGPVIVFIKKVIRKLLKIFLGWYLFPIYARQSFFNGKIVNAVAMERELLYSLNDQIAASRNEAQALRQQIDAARQTLDEYRGEMAALSQRTGEQLSEVRERLRRIENLPTDDDDFYHEFEERFRGTRDEIRNRLRIYIPHIKERLPDWTKGRFIDVGSGRGEWLDVLKENGATDYIGVDLNARQNAVAESFGHKTACEDCIQYLARQPDESIDLITSFQVIEHLCMSDLMELLRQSHRVLKKGGMLLFETQNPTNLIVGADTFYIDPSHKRPLDPRTVEFFAQWSGFSDVKILDANAHPRWSGLSLEGRKEKDIDDIKKINDIFWLIYGPMDYAVFGVKE